MAVAFRFGNASNQTNVSGTTIAFLTPAANIVAGDIWICSAIFRGGSTVTISGVPASFQLIGRVDQGSGTTVCTLVSWWYLATGTEPAGTTWLTITISSASKAEAVIDAFSGVNTAAPVVAGSIRTATAAGAATVTPAAFSAGQAGYMIGGDQGSATAPAVVGTGITSDGAAFATAGGAAATNVGFGAGYGLTSGGTGWGLSNVSQSTGCVQTFTLDVPPEDSPALELSSFGTFTGVGSGDTINSVTASIRQYGSSAAVAAPTYQLWDGTTAQIGTTRTGTASTSTTNTDTVVFTGVSYSQLATLRFRVYAHAPSGATHNVDSVGLTVNYTPAGAAPSTKTQPATARVTNTVTRTQGSIARIQGVGLTRTQPAIARIVVATVLTKTEPAVARLQAVGLTKTQPGTARVTNLVARTQPAITRIRLVGLTAVQPATARIRDVGLTKTQPATARIVKTLTITQPGLARIAITGTRTQPGTARIQKTGLTNTQPAVARLTAAVVLTKTQPATARVLVVGLTKTQPATARIRVAGLTATQPAIAHLVALETITQPATARVRNAGMAKTEPAVARIQVGGGLGAVVLDTGGSTLVNTSTTSGILDITTAAVGATCYALVALGANEASVTLSGWTQILAGDEAAASHYALYRRVKLGGDTTFTVSWPTATRGVIGWEGYTGVDPTTPDEGAAITLHSTLTTGFATPSVTPSGAGRWALALSYSRSTTVGNQPETWMPDANQLSAEDASFEGGTVGTWATYSNCTLANTTVGAHVGTHALAITSVSATTMTAQSGAYVVSPSTPYQLRGWFYPATGPTRTVGIFFRWTDSGGADITTSAVLVPETAGWTQNTVNATSPPNAAFCNLRAIVLSPAAGETHYLDDVYLAALTERLDTVTTANPWVAMEIADSNAPVTQAAHSYTAILSAAESHGGAILLYLIPAPAGGPTFTQPGVARIAKVFTSAVPGVARIRNTGMTRTQPATARITNTMTRTQPGMARVQIVGARTQPAVARISKSLTFTQAATARIQVTGTRTQPGVARVNVVGLTKTQPAITRVAGAAGGLTKTQPAIARIAIGLTKTQPAIARISNTGMTKTQPGIARVSESRSSTQGAIARVRNTGVAFVQHATARILEVGLTKTQPAVARISESASSTHPGIARIQGVGLTKTQPATAKILVSAFGTHTQPATARITDVGLTRTQPAVAKVQIIPSVTQPAVARVRDVGLVKTQPATARLRDVGLAKTQAGTARVSDIGLTTVQHATARIQVIGLTRTQPAVATILVQTTGTRTQAGTARIRQPGLIKAQPAITRVQITGATATRTQPATTRVLVTGTRTQPGAARIVSTLPRTQPAQARIRQPGMATTQPATARILGGQSRTQPAITRVAIVGTRAQPAITRVRNASLQRTQPAVARILGFGTTNKSIQGLTRIAIVAARLQPARARVALLGTKIQPARARVLVSEARGVCDAPPGADRDDHAGVPGTSRNGVPGPPPSSRSGRPGPPPPTKTYGSGLYGSGLYN